MLGCRCFPATFGMPARVAANPNKPCLEESVEGKVKMLQPDVFLRIWHGAIHAYIAIICNICAPHVLNYTTIYIYIYILQYSICFSVQFTCDKSSVTTPVHNLELWLWQIWPIIIHLATLTWRCYWSWVTQIDKSISNIILSPIPTSFSKIQPPQYNIISIYSMRLDYC